MREANNPGGAGKTLSCSCCVGMIIEMVKSGAPMSVKGHHVQLISQSFSMLALVGRVGSRTMSSNTGKSCLATFYMGYTAALLVNKMMLMSFQRCIKATTACAELAFKVDHLFWFTADCMGRLYLV